MHVELQLAGVPYEQEEHHSQFVDAVMLSLYHPKTAELLEAGTFGLVSRVKPGFWEALVDLGQRGR